MPNISVRRLYQDNKHKLSLSWVASRAGSDNLISNEEQRPTQALVGHLNFIHPNRVQVLGLAESEYLNKLEQAAARTALDQLFHKNMAVVIVANGQPVPRLLQDYCQTHNVPLMSTPLESPYLMDVLRIYLARALAVSTVMHGVFLDVLEIGVLIMGDSAMGKSELALELISRGHGLVADDAVDLYRVSRTAIEGRCPELLMNLLEVRGIGLLDIKAIFGETAVRRKMRLKLIVHLVRKETMEREFERMPYEPLYEEIMGVPIRKAVIAVDAGRNLAVLTEAATRLHILRTKGIDPAAMFIARHSNLLERSTP